MENISDEALSALYIDVNLLLFPPSSRVLVAPLEAVLQIAK